MPHPHGTLGLDIAACDLRVLHADDHLLAFDKPSGLLSVPGRGADKQDCLVSRAQMQWPEAAVVHRLDMATSGVIVLARGPAMQRALNAAFEQRRVDKAYVAIVDGWLDSDAGTIDLPLRADWPNRPRQIVDTRGGKPAVTRWRALQRLYTDDGAPCTRLSLAPETGRTHQLRVHLRALGHPILGDTLYAGVEAQARVPRMLLHATSLAFAHPATERPLQITCAAPF